MKKIAVFLIFSLFVFLGCGDNAVNEPKIDDTQNVEFVLNVFPVIGGPNTEFNFSLKEKSGYDFDVINYQIKIDFDKDGVYETELENKASLKHILHSIGKKEINGKIKFGTKEYSFTNTVFVVEPQIILEGQSRFIYEPQIYNSPKIVFTWGGDDANGNHALHMMDYDGSNRTCIFCGVDGIDIGEMHSGFMSPNGEKIIWNRGGRTYLSYIYTNQFENNIFDPNYYEPGKMFWSLTSDKLFMIDDDGEGVLYLYGINFIARDVVDYGKFISAVPGQDLQIAILNESELSTDDSVKSNLNIYDLVSLSVIKEYKNIPAFGSFKVIDNGKKLYFEKPMMIYDLEKNKANYLWFDEIPFAQHSEGESDITIEGDKIIFSVFDNDYDKRNFYMFNIPINEL